MTQDWQEISTAPRDGTRVEVRHHLCPGYDCKGQFINGQWQTENMFVSGKTMMMYENPTHWRNEATA